MSNSILSKTDLTKGDSDGLKNGFTVVVVANLGKLLDVVVLNASGISSTYPFLKLSEIGDLSKGPVKILTFDGSFTFSFTCSSTFGFNDEKPKSIFLPNLSSNLNRSGRLSASDKSKLKRSDASGIILKIDFAVVVVVVDGFVVNVGLTRDVVLGIADDVNDTGLLVRCVVELVKGLSVLSVLIRVRTISLSLDWERRELFGSYLRDDMVVVL